MDEIEITTEEERDLTMSEGMVKVVLGAAAAYLAKHFIEKAIESGFRHRNP